MWDVTENVFMGTSGRSAPEGVGQCVWEYDGQEWKVKAVLGSEAGSPGQPPGVAGRFKGQLRVVPCVATSRT